MKHLVHPRRHAALRMIAALGIVALCSAGSSEARADPSAADKISAKALFEMARALTKDGKYEEACPKLAESQRLDPSMGTEFYLAECNEQLGKIATAWIYYEEVANLAQAAGQKQRQIFTRGRADALKARVPKLAIEVPVALQDTTGLVIKRDKGEVARAQWGLSLPVDPAKYVISAEAKGKKIWSVTIEMREGRSETVKIPVLDDAGGAVAKPVVPAPIPPSTQPITPLPTVSPKAKPVTEPIPQPVQAGTGTAQRTTGFVIGAVGVVGVAIGGGFGALALSKHNASKAPERCDAQNMCDQAGLDLQDDAFRAATVSTVGMVIGVVALAGGVVLVTTAPKRPRSAKLSLGPGSISLAGSW